ncbi:MAG: hypothetical protein Q8M24_18365 [Pseudolabrys sp.]|nr:hypothetical protein [Pseudolabrys sp.]MDP2297411.1 hypothetical protein [Pseudolabrys sp.]
MKNLKEAPHDRITIACFTYMVRAMELRRFNGFFFGIIESTQKLTENLTLDGKAEFERIAADYQKKNGGILPGRHFVNEIALTRSIESFDLYLLQMLRLLFSAKPDLVIAEEKLIGEATKASFEDTNDYFLHLAERKLMKLSYSSLSVLREYVRESSEIDLFDTDEIFETICLATELRNLISHNDCRVNEIFLKRTKSIPATPKLELGERFAISDAFLRNLISAADHAVFTYDERAAAQLGLLTMNRFTSFFLRGDFATSTV